ncbi:hypothetical protein K470DRAFT_194944, partial [Piedraia hortae CBS 480.64]
PWLLPSNRKLRNVVSISLRNHSLTTVLPRRARGKTIDDDAVPQMLQSPTKLAVLKEHSTIGHSRSSSDLRIDTGQSSNAGMMAQRPFQRRRQGTLEWAHATPQKRQEKLLDVTAKHIADVFFSIHVPGIKEPVYISEVVEQTMNPTWQQVDWSGCCSGATRQDWMTLAFWVRTAANGWRQLLQLSLCLTDLHYLGKSESGQMPRNTVIFHLSDGVYTSFESLSDYKPPPLAPPRDVQSPRALPTSSFDALLRLAKLEDSISDAVETREQIAADLGEFLRGHDDALSERGQVSRARDRLKTIEYAKTTIERQLEKARKQQAEKRAALAHRRRLMEQGKRDDGISSARLHQARQDMPQIHDEHAVQMRAIANQRRRICEDVHKIYSIQSVPGQSLAFTIRDLPVLNPDHLDGLQADQAAAALGYVVHVVQLLAIYLMHPLPYHVHYCGSTSTIEDLISLLKTGNTTDDRRLRTYPLFIKGVPRFRFEYAVFLLNKNIQLLLESIYHVRGLDIRHTLPNLKYLLYLSTAGEGELPARKVGGVRGLVK